MKKFIWIFVLFSFVVKISLASMGEYCSTPPFLVAGVKPNILIILDNSNSMDEDFYGNAVGSYSPKSKSVVAKKELIRIIKEYRDRFRVGLITYRLPRNVRQYYIHNSPYFVSYQPKSYCPDAPKDCEEYCATGSLSAKGVCEDTCKDKNPSFDPDYFDEIITNYPVGSEERKRYCHLVYPKTQRFKNPYDPSNYLYFKTALPMYSSSNLRTAFCYSVDYNPDEGKPYDEYYCYKRKYGTSDSFEGYVDYWFNSKFTPTDTDFALGFDDFGRRLAWWYIGRTWFSNKSPGDGYIHVKVNDLTDSYGNTTSTYSKLINKLDPKENDENGYMSCRRRNKNKCPYIINAGLTPTAGTFDTAIEYLTGDETPVEYKCQQTFVIYVTDGLPSVDTSGNTDTADNLLPDVLDRIDTLRNLDIYVNGKMRTFDIKTFVLGLGLTEDAKKKLDRMAVHGGTDVNGHAYYADNPEELRKALNVIFQTILKKVTSSTSVAAFAERSKKGAIAVQSVFYPEKKFSDKTTTWIGYLYNYWYYNSPDVQNLREDTIQNRALDKIQDNIIEFDLDSYGHLIINAYSADTAGKKDSLLHTYTSLDDIKPVWEGGTLLKDRDAGDRKIFTVDSNALIPFSVPYRNFFAYKLGNPDTFNRCLGNEKNEKIENLIRYIRGEDIKGCRNRTVDIAGSVWKLGDIVYSTPKIVSYKDYGYSVIYVGSNDGMLHAFKLGYLSKKDLDENQVVKLCSDKNNCSEESIGEELWAFIPENVLPYLRYLPDPNYCHIYFVDLSPYIFEYKSKKILIGGMRLGGACGCSGSSCVNPPPDTCASEDSCLGLSSYFALDITDPENPVFLWEFSHKDLGFSFSGPAVVKKENKNYVVFASGPTNYIGDSNQSLRLFVVDVDTGKLIRTIDTGIQNAFGGRLFTEGLDFNEDGQTDYIILGYGRKDGDMRNWKGGIILLDTRDEDILKWSYSTYLDSAQNAIIAKVETMRCFGRWYIFFGSGRWFYKTDNPLPGQRERIYGIPLNCDKTGCTPNLSIADVTYSSSNVCTDAKNGVTRGWYIELDPSEEGYFKERVITDPTKTDQNVIIFPTSQPTADLCGFGGRSRVWILNCATGGALNENCPGYEIKNVSGKLLLQLTGGDIREISLSEYLSSGTPKRKSNFYQGMLPENSLPFITPAEAGKKVRKGKILLWFEK